MCTAARRRLALAAVGVAVTAGIACAGSAPPPEGRGAAGRTTAGRRVLLVGVDAADWLAIEPLAAAGRLPAFARLRAGGHAARLVATPPLVSPLVWTTIATGRHPEDHGVLDFMADLPGGGQTPVTAASRRVAALWNVASDRGRSVAVVGWWATWPAEDVRGTIVSDRVAPQLLRPEPFDERAIHPTAQAQRLSSAVVRPEQVAYEDLARYVPLTREEHARARSSLASGGRAYRDPLAHLAAVIAATRTYGAMAEAILRSQAPDLTAVYFEAVDTVSHLFVADRRRGPPAIEAAYRDVDALLARLAAAAPPDTWVVVASDHGFHPPDAGVSEDPADLTGAATAWHRPYGIVAAAEARRLAGEGSPPAAVGDISVAVSPLDVAPTVLHAAGLPVSDEMPGRVVPELVDGGARARTVERVRAFPASRVAAAALPGDDGAIERLKALGYVGATATSLARLNLGEVLYRRGKLEAAERELRAVVDAQPQNLSARLWLARALRDQGRPRDAFRAYAAALRLPGGAAAAATAAAECAVAAGEVDAAAPLFPRPRAVSREAAAVRTARAILSRARQRTSQAEAELHAALEADPSSFEALSVLLDIAIDAGRPASALPAARKAVSRARRSPRLLALLGEALLAAKKPGEAEAVLEEALALAPDGDSVRLELARSRLQQGHDEAALATLDPARASPDRSVLRGAALTRLGRWADAAAAYRDALDRGDETAPVLNGLAWAELRSGRRDEAARVLERSLALDGGQATIRRLLADVHAGREVR